MDATFHLSLGVPELQPSMAFFTDILSAEVRHLDPSGYVNLELAGIQLTLKENPDAKPDSQPSELHFGINVDVDAFERILASVRRRAPGSLIAEPRVVDAGTPLERRKLYLRCPAGYLLEIKGFRKQGVAA
ncbi:MAG TPA: hypothetical protein VF254_11165 [Gammaproteobacteria bacterium]